MMQTQLYTTELCHIFVKGMITNGKKTVEGFFLIDTGCDRNILDKKVVEELKFTLVPSVKKIDTLNNDHLNTKEIKLSFNIEKISYEEDFVILDESQNIFGEGSRMLGILGLNFLFDHHFILDYEIMQMYSYEEEIASKIGMFKRFSPFSFGLKNFGLPVLAMNNCKEDNIIMTLLDTGSSENIISERAVIEYKIKFEEKHLAKDIYDSNSSVSMNLADLHFGLLMFSKGSDKYVFTPYDSEFAISRNKDFFMENEEGQKIAAILGAKYFMSNKCVIDFSTNNLYSSLW